jgi:hypothetical protein
MVDETQLWAWFLFSAGLVPQRAKTLLSAWDQRGLTLRAALEALPAQANALGLTPEEVAKLRPPHELPAIDALRWNESLYPLGLHQLPFKLRPALLFYSGDLSLLMRPIIYLAPGPLDDETRELLQETVGILLGENLLLAAFRESPQAALLLEEMAASEGEVLLFAKQGLAQLTLPENEQALWQVQRLLILSPLPPNTPPNPAWDDVLQQVVAGAAMHSVYSHTTALEKIEGNINAILLATSPGIHTPQGIRVVTNAVEAALWLTELPVTPANAGQQPAAAPSAPLGLTVELPIDPPPSPAEALRVLEQGGRVPEALKKRLFSH